MNVYEQKQQQKSLKNKLVSLLYLLRVVYMNQPGFLGEIRTIKCSLINRAAIEAYGTIIKKQPEQFTYWHERTLAKFSKCFHNYV